MKCTTETDEFRHSGDDSRQAGRQSALIMLLIMVMIIMIIS